MEAHPDDTPRDGLRRLRLAGLVAPVAFIALVLAAWPLLDDRLGHELAMSVLGATLVVGAVAFGLLMYALIGRAHAAVLARDAALAGERTERRVDAERHAAALTERDRIARELHDSLAQVLGVAHLKLQALGARTEVRASDRVAREVHELADLCHDGYRDVREAILGLKDAHLPRPALVEHLASYVDRFSRLSGVPTTLSTDDDDLRLSPAAEVQVIRVVQEALTNVRKHAGATRAEVAISVGGDDTTFVVSDDGRGFFPDEPRPDRYGLASMRERAESIGGRLVVHSHPGIGTKVAVRVPREHRLEPEELTA